MLKPADESDDRSPEASPRPDPSPDEVRTPQVAVVYRSRGVPWWFIPPLLVVAAVVGVVSYRRIEPTRPRVVYVKETMPNAAPSVASPASPAVVATVASAEPSAVPGPTPVLPAPVSAVAPASPTLPLPTPAEPTPPPTGPSVPVYEEPVLAGPVPSADAAPEPRVAPKPVPPRSAVGFDPDALKIAAEGPAPPQDPPSALSLDTPGRAAAPPDNALPIDDIQAEAKRIAYERRRMAALKRSVAKPNPFLDRKLREQRMTLARRDADTRRKPFLDELRELVKTNDVRVVPEILALCDRSGRETAPELLDAAFGELAGPASHLSTKGKVERLRAWGVPEPIILDHVIDSESGDIGSRNGPRNQAIVTLRAARQLVSVPLAAPKPKPTPRAVAPTPSASNP